MKNRLYAILIGMGYRTNIGFDTYFKKYVSEKTYIFIRTDFDRVHIEYYTCNNSDGVKTQEDINNLQIALNKMKEDIAKLDEYIIKEGGSNER